MARAKPKNIRQTLRNFSVYFKKHIGTLLLVALLAVISSFASVLGTYLIKPIINEYILPGNMDGLVRILIFTAVMYGIGILATIGYTQIMVRVGQQIVRELREDMFDKVQRLPLRFFDTHTHGELMSRFTNDVDTIAEALNNSFTVIIQSFVTIVGTFLMLFVLEWRLSLIVLCSFFIMVLYLRYSNRKSHAYFTQQQAHLAGVNSFVEEMVEGQKVVQIFNHEKANMKEFGKRNEALRKAGVGALTYTYVLIPVVVSISYVNYALSACVGAFFALAGVLDPGGLASYLVFVRQTAMPINQLSQQLNILMAALAGAEHIFEITSQKPEVDEGMVTLQKMGGQKWEWAVPQPDGQKKFIPLQGDVQFEDVVFGYNKHHPVLKNISLYAKPGQKIAFVGSTGAGKTTITNLINRFYDIDSGAILYDSIDLRQMKKDDLRQSLAVVLQDTHLFTGSIADNIRYGKLDATNEEVTEAAKLANADSFIRRLPQGYDTFVTGDGSNLSAGQRQLLAIARAAIVNPPVLILDEATSSIDTYTEKMVGIGMDRLMQGRTVFVIAHRLSTVRNANAIIVLENGEIIERGTHEELVAQRGRYYQLYTGQTELA